MTTPLIIMAVGITYAATIYFQRHIYDEYITLSAKYADAASLLTSMRAKADDLQEKLDFSEDVRYGLGMDNARMAKRIEELEKDAERGQEVRWCLVEAVAIASEAASDAIDKVAILERSLRIARHKEFKRWKKAVRQRPRERGGLSPASLHYAIRTARFSYARTQRDWSAKERMRGYIDKIRTMEPYPLP